MWPFRSTLPSEPSKWEYTETQRGVMDGERRALAAEARFENSLRCHKEQIINDVGKLRLANLENGVTKTEPPSTSFRGPLNVRPEGARFRCTLDVVTGDVTVAYSFLLDATDAHTIAQVLNPPMPFPLEVPEVVVQEVAAADAKWGPQDHGDLVWLAVLQEEVGEAAQAILEARAGGVATVQGNTYLSDALTKEVTQCAAVAIRWLDARGRATGGEEIGGAE